MDLYLIHWPGTHGVYVIHVVYYDILIIIFTQGTITIFSIESTHLECFGKTSCARYSPIMLPSISHKQTLFVGLCKSIGVSNYTINHLKELLLHCKIKPAVNQVEFTPRLFQVSVLTTCCPQLSHSFTERSSSILQRKRYCIRGIFSVSKRRQGNTTICCITYSH